MQAHHERRGFEEGADMHSAGLNGFVADQRRTEGNPVACAS